MTIVGLDDTDSRERGMCTTYAAHAVAERLDSAGHGVERVLLVRLNPAAPHKTRGNAALAIHTDADPDSAFDAASAVVSDAAAVEDSNTQPGVVVAPDDGAGASEFAWTAVRDLLDLDDALALADDLDYRHEGWRGGRGRIGALAAVGAWTAFSDWTYERISYREHERRGTPREFSHESVFAAADEGYPDVWDTVDRGEGEAVCVPHTPGPVLHGIRGDSPDAVRAVADAIESEPVYAARTFVTNQGTDAHLRDAALTEVADGGAYRVAGTVASEPETRRGGHVFLTLEADGDTLDCAAFEPTKRFRDRVRALRPGDRVLACGEVSEGTLKLEKLRVDALASVEHVTPTCPDCGTRMESAGRDQGYRCRDCDTAAPGKVEQPLRRDLSPGWYEVPPCARRHVSKPLVRGGFDAPTHLEG
ncbi:tRNA(Ile)(2)-agmatinylcytidine synthase [Salarchaeum japonicum]|uniref:tRNA(Ile2) 2-agmatinylcytidine synthetase TiaS n=1 Tax=Salarchaeum japonicum TaxID=555573 RepID=A0AAV3SZE7_9EURY|nr:tRNA(Ile)(2)-agmatinylcytidine synthase [Salarchaeum japonicum]